MRRTLTLSALAVAAMLAFAAISDDVKEPSCCAAKGKKAAATKNGVECEKAVVKVAVSSDAMGAMCADAEKTEVALTGKLLCDRSNLKKRERCSPVFQAEGREGSLPICPETKDLTAFKAAGNEGESVLEVKGYLCKTKDGKEMLTVTSFVKKAGAKA